MTCTKALAVALAMTVLTPAAANAEEHGLHVWGKLSHVKKTAFFQLKYRATEGKRSSKRSKTKKVFLVVAEGAEFFLDRMVPMASLEKGLSVWLYGKPAEREILSDGGGTTVDRQILNTMAIAFGEALNVTPDPKAKGPDGQVWLRATVTKPGRSLHVQYEGRQYKVICLKSCAVLARYVIPKRPKLKKTLLVEVTAIPSDERPEKAKDGDLGYAALRIIVLDKRLQRSVYPLLLPR